VDRTIKHFSIIASSSEIQVPDILIKSDDEVRRYFNAVMPDPPDSLAEDRRKRWIAQRDLEIDQAINGPSVRMIERSIALGSTYLLSRQDPFIEPSNTSRRSGLRMEILKNGNLNPQTFEILSKCPKNDRLGGIVVSNAAAVEGALPEWDTSTQSLSYRVAGPHLKSDGSKNVGYYLLELDREIAECIWESDLNQSNVQVSVTSDDGTTNIATSKFEENGLSVRFEVAGFHYSASRIQIGVAKSKNQSTSSTPASTSGEGKPTISLPTSTNKGVKKSLTITCQRGSTKKKITATNPKCPKGYKRT
jgi:hypothetical protein